MTTNPKVDTYINRSSDFAKPILTHIRKVVHEACPEVQEKIKWGFPHFDYKNEMMCSMAAFKAHCAFTFWKGSIMKDPENVMEKVGRTAMGQFGRITSLKDLPGAPVIRKYVKEAMQLNDEGIKVPSNSPKKVIVPEILKKALNKHPEAKSVFENLPKGHQREYAEWIAEAKREKTRESRLEKCLKELEKARIKNT